LPHASGSDENLVTEEKVQLIFLQTFFSFLIDELPQLKRGKIDKWQTNFN